MVGVAKNRETAMVVWEKRDSRLGAGDHLMIKTTSSSGTVM